MRVRSLGRARNIQVDAEGHANEMHSPTNMQVFTIGHSTRPLEEFIALLSASQVTLLVDIRLVPASRRFPQFAQAALAMSLASAGVDYLHLKDLGGRRTPRVDSPHVGWRSRVFRGYADYMESSPWATAMATLLERAQTATSALMCAEALPWRCHRQLVADALVARGATVWHIMSQGRLERHRLTPFARVDGTRIVYDRTGTELPLLAPS